MQRHTLAILAVAAASFAPFLGGCVGTKQPAGIQQVDSLVSRIERLDLEAELAQQQAQEAVGALRSIVRGELRTDAVKSHTGYLDAVERSANQLRRMRDAVPPMQRAAASVFESWAVDTQAILSPTLREKSAERRAAAGDRYLAILEALEPAEIALAAFNGTLRDHALFLGNDLNSSSIQSLEPELERLRQMLAIVDQRVQNLHRAAADYVRSSAPLGKVQVSGSGTGSSR